MKKKRKQGLDDSFDMFLDTITNTFGGVLLIALLIVLMIRESSDAAPQSVHSGPTEDAALVQSEIDAMEARKSALAAGLQIQQQFESDFQNEEVAALAQNLAQLTSKKSELEQAVNQMSSKSKQLDFQKTGIETKQVDLNQQLSEQQNKLKELNDELIQQQQLRTRTITLPKESATSKSEVAMVFENNELFTIEPLGDRNSGSINKTHFETCSRSQADLHIGGIFYRTKIGSGIPLNKNRLAEIFKSYRPDSFYLTFVVRTDSFEKFSQLREQCVGSGFEYRLIVGDDLISEGGANGAKTQ